MKAAIARRAKELGFERCGVTTATPPPGAPHFESWLKSGRHGEMAYLTRNAHKRMDPRRVLPGARSVVCVAAAYTEGAERDTPRNSRVIDPRSDAPTGQIARYARATDYHEFLRVRLKALRDYIDTIGGPGTRSIEYIDTGPILERDLAQRAGIGFIGKHTNLIGRRQGNWLFLAEVLSTLDLNPDSPERNRCGTCARCLEACPTQAITAPFQLDARRCISYLTIELKGPIPAELRPAIGDRIFGCDDCLEVCPWNRFAKQGALMKDQWRPELFRPDLLELLQLDRTAFKMRFEGTPLLRSKRRGLLRNVCVALGNTATRTALPALHQALDDEEPLIAEHAAWAIERIEARGPVHGKPPSARAHAQDP